MRIKSSPRRVAREIIDLSDHKRKEILCLLDTDTRIQVIEQLVDLRIKTARFGRHLASIAGDIHNERTNNNV